MPGTARYFIHSIPFHPLKTLDRGGGGSGGGGRGRGGRGGRGGGHLLGTYYVLGITLSILQI